MSNYSFTEWRGKWIPIPIFNSDFFEIAVLLSVRQLVAFICAETLKKGFHLCVFL